MARSPVKDLISRANTAWTNQQMWNTLVDDAYKFASPQNATNDGDIAGQKKGNDLFDSTMMVSTRRAVDKFVSQVFPAEQKWCLLKPGPSAEKEDNSKQLALALQTATDIMFSVIHNRSNFQPTIGEMVREMWISTGVMTVQKGKTIAEPIAFHCLPQKQVAFEEGPFGSVGAKFRQFNIKGILIDKTWPKAQIPEKVQKEIREDNDKKYKVIECTYTVPDDEKAYYDVILVEDETRIIEETLRLDRFIVGRLSRNPSEVNGRGPVLDALPDAKTMNKLVELVLKNATLAVTGMWTVVDDGVINPDTVVIGPNRMIPVARNPGHPSGASIAPLERSGDFNIAFTEYERLKSSIKEALLDLQLPSMEGQPRSASEILARVKQYVEETGSFYSRVQREVIVPIVQNILDILHHDWKMIDEVVIDGSFINLEITSPLAVQRKAAEVEAVVQAMEISKAMFGPEATAAVFKVEEILPWIAKQLNVPENLLFDKTETKEMGDAAGAAITNLEAVKPGAGLDLASRVMQGA